jgi:hypothetical protein
MLDVHAPEHGIGGPRDFMIHLLTITVGLLIALGLENAAEAMHHRHQRREAETMIRQELRDNEQLIESSKDQFEQERNGMNAVLADLELMSQGKTPATPLVEKEFVFHQAPMQDSAWRTASSTGVLSYMDYDEVERFSGAYKEQDQLEQMELKTLEDYLQLIPILMGHPKDIDAERAKDARVYARLADAHLNGMYFIAVGTLGSYKQALQ